MSETTDTEQPTSAEAAPTEAISAESTSAEPTSAEPTSAEAEVKTETASIEGPPKEESETEESTAEVQKEVAPTEAITVTPSTRLTTTSMVTTQAAESSSKKHRRPLSKIEAANEFVYGRQEEAWTRPERKPSTEIPATFRSNRTQTMRRGCIMKRVQTMELERSQTSKRSRSRSPLSDDSSEPIAARPVPRAVYEEPKITIRNTKSSKFRYLFNRKPPGVKVYFKPANADQNKKPPFVVSFAHQC